MFAEVCIHIHVHVLYEKPVGVTGRNRRQPSGYALVQYESYGTVRDGMFAARLFFTTYDSSPCSQRKKIIHEKGRFYTKVEKYSKNEKHRGVLKVGVKSSLLV